MLLTEGKQVKLLFKEKISINKTNLLSHFEKKPRYYICFNEQYYTVKNKKSFTKLFPQYKKQINAFAKEQKLDFINDASQSLTSLANYCEKVINFK
jgi:hypothetical protein